MKKKLIGFVLTFLLCMGMTMVVSAEKNVTVLPVPTNLNWTDRFNLQWDVVEETHGYYYVEVYKDEEPFWKTGWITSVAEGKTVVEATFSPQVMESGTYKFRVASADKYDPDNTDTSDWSDWSEPKVYTRPEKQLGTTTIWWTEKKGGYNMPGVTNAAGYIINLYKVDDEGNYVYVDCQKSLHKSVDPEEGDYIYDGDMYDEMTGPGRYAIQVQALSLDITQIANGPVGKMSKIYELVEEIPQNGWHVTTGANYWYENGIKQGTYDDPKGVIGDGTVRGREIYDPVSDGWYWLDSVYDGARAVNKEVWMPYIYQDEAKWEQDEIRFNAEASGDMAEQVIREINNRTGKWVRYDENGKMYKGWYKVEGAQAAIYPDQVGNTYYYDHRTGLMAKGEVEIDGVVYYFDEITGVLQQ